LESTRAARCGARLRGGRCETHVVDQARRQVLDELQTSCGSGEQVARHTASFKPPTTSWCAPVFRAGRVLAIAATAALQAAHTSFR